jgi:hypothetical protein
MAILTFCVFGDALNAKALLGHLLTSINAITSQILFVLSYFVHGIDINIPRSNSSFTSLDQTYFTHGLQLSSNGWV